MKKLFVLCLALAFPITAHEAATFSGTYVCNKKGIVDSMEFRSGTRVVLIALGTRFPTTYTVEGNFLYIKYDKGAEFSFKIESNGTLTGDDTWTKKAVCTKS